MRGLEDGSDEAVEVLLEQQRVVEPEPPDSGRRDAGGDQVADGLVEGRRLADAARPEHELEPVRVVVVQPLPEQLGQGTLDLTRQGWRHLAGTLPGVLLVEDALQVFWLRPPNSQLCGLLMRLPITIRARERTTCV